MFEAVGKCSALGEESVSNCSISSPFNNTCPVGWEGVVKDV